MNVPACLPVIILGLFSISFCQTIPTAHPRLLGTKAYLQQIAQNRSAAFQRVVSVANNTSADDYPRMISLGLVSCITNDSILARQAIQIALTYINGPIKIGHIPFGSDLAHCALVYDLCFDYWTSSEKAAFVNYMNATVDSNINSETQVFHNSWYGYKNWGIGLACYAAFHENPRAPAILDTLLKDYHTRAVPALQMAGNGGGWAEGYYVHYWSYEWMFFCEAALRCAAEDFFADVPAFYSRRAIGSMFEMYPGISDYGSRRPVPMGDGGGRVFGGDRDKALSARRILANHFRNDPSNQVAHSYNETTPRSSVGIYAYKDFLWRDTTGIKGDLVHFKLSHIATGPGYVYARSSWDDTATYFFFKCGDRFTAHQHLDVGNFIIYKNSELIGDGGHYDNFGSSHDVNYHLRSIAHNTMLIYNPTEVWNGATSYSAGIRAGTVTGNDGGQHHDFPNHNGAVSDVPAWMADSDVYNIGDIFAFKDYGYYLYVACNCSRAYSSAKMDFFTRQIVFIRPGTFVIFDRVKSKNASFAKTWNLQAMKVPMGTAPNLTITNGAGRLFVQTILPQNPQVQMASGANLYTYGGQTYSPSANTGPAPECRVQISPSVSSLTDYFLHVLTAVDTSVKSAPSATVQNSSGRLGISINGMTIAFDTAQVGGAINISGNLQNFPSVVDTVYGNSSVAPSSNRKFPDKLLMKVDRIPHSRAMRITVSQKLSADKSGQVILYTASGRRVWSFPVDPKTSSIVWDGRDKAGIPVSPGTYFCFVKLQDSHQTSTMFAGSFTISR